MNMYAYVGGDPVNLRDPSGMSGLILRCQRFAVSVDNSLPFFSIWCGAVQHGIAYGIPSVEGPTPEGPTRVGGGPKRKCAKGVTVKQDGNNVTINVDVNFTGSQNTAANRAETINSIQSRWTGQFGRYNTTTIVGTGLWPYNGVEISFLSGSGGAILNGGGDAAYQNSANAIYLFPQAAGGLSLAPHEVGHPLGLGNRYTMINGKPVNHPGYDGNIMASGTKGTVWEQDIADIIAGCK